MKFLHVALSDIDEEHPLNVFPQPIKKTLAKIIRANQQLNLLALTRLVDRLLWLFFSMQRLQAVATCPPVKRQHLSL